jgi:ParB family chromosome partitioning protein
MRRSGDALRYPAAIPERLGLALAAALDRDAQAAKRLARALDDAMPTDSGRGARGAGKGPDRGVRKQALNRRTGPKNPREIVKGVKLEARRGRVVLSGAGVTEALRRDLEDWLTARG